MEIKFDVYFKKNLGTLFKSNEVDLDGIPAYTNLDLNLVDRLEANYKVGTQKYTDNVSVFSIEERVIQIPFKSDVVRVGLNEFEIVAYMKNGDIKVSQTYTYNIDEGIGEGKQSGSGELSDGHTHSNLNILNSITQTKVNEWNNKADATHSHSEYASKNHTHNASEIEGLENVDIDLSDYYTKSETYNKTEIDSKIANMGTGGSVDLSNYATKSELEVKANKSDTYTKAQTDNKISEEIAKAQLGGEDSEIDLSGYATKDDLSTKADKTELPTKTSELINDSNFISNIPNEYITETELNNKGYLTSVPSEYITELELDSKGYATEQYVKNEISKAQLEGEDVDLSAYALKTELPTKTSELINNSGYLTSIPSEYITEMELDAKGYLTQHQDLSSYALKTELHNHNNKEVLDSITNSKIDEWNNKSDFDGNYNSLTNKPTIPSIEGLATETFVRNEISKAQLSGGDSEIDLSGYATKDELNVKADKTELPTKVSQLINDSGYLTSIPSEYITDSELSSKGYLTSVPSEYAKKTDLHSHSNKTVLDGITSAKVIEWNNKSTFDGDYNSLTNKPAIPNIEGLASKEEIPTKISELINDSNFISSIPVEYITEEELDSKGYLTQHQDISHLATKEELFSKDYNDLTNKPSIPTVPSNISAFVNDKGYLTSVPSEYITESELNSKGYLTSVPSTYALKTDIPTIPASLPANGGNSDTVNGFSIWSGTQAEFDEISVKDNNAIYMIKEA